MILHRDKLRVALRGEGVKRGHQVQFILAGGKEGIDNLHGNLDFYLRFLGVLLVEDMNDQVIVLLATRTSRSLLCTVTNSPSLAVRIASTRARRSTSLT